MVVGPNLAVLVLASTLGLHPLAATVVHNGSAIAAGLNGLRPLMHIDTPAIGIRKDRPQPELTPLTLTGGIVSWDLFIRDKPQLDNISVK